MRNLPPESVRLQLAPYRWRALHHEAAKAVLFARHNIPVTGVRVVYRKSWLGDTWSVRGSTTVKTRAPHDHAYTLAMCFAAGPMAEALWLHRVDGVPLPRAKRMAVKACGTGSRVAIARARGRIKPRMRKSRVFDEALKLVESHWSEVLRVADALDRHGELGGRKLRALLGS